MARIAEMPGVRQGMDLLAAVQPENTDEFNNVLKAIKRNDEKRSTLSAQLARPKPAKLARKREPTRTAPLDEKGPSSSEACAESSSSQTAESSSGDSSGSSSSTASGKDVKSRGSKHESIAALKIFMPGGGASAGISLTHDPNENRFRCFRGQFCGHVKQSVRSGASGVWG